MKSLQLLFLAFTATWLSACATSTPIRRYSESKSAFNPGPVLMSHTQPDSSIYRIYQRSSSGFTSIDTLREDVEERAEKFCSRQGLGMIVLGEKTSSPPYILGNFPRIEIVFATVQKPAQR